MLEKRIVVLPQVGVAPKDLYYAQILSSLPPQPPNTSLRKHIHNHITHRSINTLKDNTLLHARPPDIHPSESSLPRKDRVHLARLRCGHHPALLSYQKRLDDRAVNSCPGCNASPHTIQHIMEDCIIHNHARKQHNIHSIKDLWENPVSAVAFLGETGLCVHHTPIRLLDLYLWKLVLWSGSFAFHICKRPCVPQLVGKVLAKSDQVA
ncbi:uncharacterized protein LOC143026373 [Oratosquilla oratoria]|uniref:uncharacterized protein LOC143026373 n=1 Tax=Oratosquilla oratoria TaxID=337810 RepID=UPI003F7669F6